MKYANKAECAAAGLDPKKVESIARRLSKLSLESDELGLTIFGGDSSGSLLMQGSEIEGRHRDSGGGSGELVVANIGGTNWDGGCSESAIGEDGLIRES